MDSTERRKVLEMLAAGKVSADDADRLLRELEGAGSERAASEDPPPSRQAPKYLRVVVDDPQDGDAVNIRVPLSLVRTGIRLTTMLPGGVAPRLADHGIDLSQLGALDGEDLVEALRDLRVDVDGGDGERVRIFCE